MSIQTVELNAGRSTGRPALALSGVSKVYGRAPTVVHALDNVSLEVRSGEFVCLVGASGCGKSTLLSLIAGLDPATAGQIDVVDRAKPALMFQDPALFPWLTVAGNVELPLKIRRMAKGDRASKVLAP